MIRVEVTVRVLGVCVSFRFGGIFAGWCVIEVVVVVVLEEERMGEWSLLWREKPARSCLFLSRVLRRSGARGARGAL